MVRRDVEAGGRRRKSRDALTSRPEIERLLDAARAPAGPRELAGEHAAVDLFHRAHLVSASTTPQGDEVSVTPSARTGLKAAVAAALAVGLMTTGAAFAASGHAPWADDAGPASSTHAADPTLPTHPTHTSGRPSDGSSPSTGPNVHAFGGLCRAYNSGNKAEHGKALESPAFAALVVAAGGTDNVATYCSTVTTGPSGSHPSHPAHPTQAVTPTHPTQGETERSHPTQAVTPTKPARPTQAPTPTHPAP
jgi:hypothetical protein